MLPGIWVGPSGSLLMYMVAHLHTPFMSEKLTLQLSHIAQSHLSEIVSRLQLLNLSLRLLLRAPQVEESMTKSLIMGFLRWVTQWSTQNFQVGNTASAVKFIFCLQQVIAKQDFGGQHVSGCSLHSRCYGSFWLCSQRSSEAAIGKGLICADLHDCRHNSISGLHM